MKVTINIMNPHHHHGCKRSRPLSLTCVDVLVLWCVEDSDLRGVRTERIVHGGELIRTFRPATTPHRPTQETDHHDAISTQSFPLGGQQHLNTRQLRKGRDQTTRRDDSIRRQQCWTDCTTHPLCA
jgi:hypothetical protein